jgi:quinol monooxygenase YgiN
MAAKLIQGQRDAVLAAPGVVGFEAAVQDDRANHFALHEVWASRADYEAYTATPAGQAFRSQLATVKGALFDDRFYRAVGPDR